MEVQRWCRAGAESREVQRWPRGGAEVQRCRFADMQTCRYEGFGVMTRQCWRGSAEVIVQVQSRGADVVQRCRNEEVQRWCRVGAEVLIWRL
jgi:hypothetical protein